MNYENYRHLHAHLFHITSNGIIVLTGDGIVVDISPAFSTITGYSRLDVVGEGFTNLLLFQKVTLFTTWQDVLGDMEMQPFYEEVGIVHKNGQQRIVRLVGYPVSNGVGQIDLYFFSMQDITKQKRAEQALQQSEARYRSIFNAASDALFIENESGKIIDVNEAACQMLQYSKEELCQFRITDLVENPLVAHELLKNSMDRFMAPVEQHYLRKDGKIICCELQARQFVIDGQMMLVAAVRDVTPRKEAQLQLLASEIRYRSLVQQSSDGVFIFDPYTGQIEEVNRQFAKMMGYEETEMRELTVEDIVAVDAADVHAKIKIIMDNNTYTFDQRPYRRRDGTLFYVEVTATIVRYHDKQVIMANVRDITLRKQAEGRLRLAEAVFDNTIDGILVTDMAGKVLSINPAFTAMTGYCAEEVIGKNYRHLRSELDDAEFLAKLWKAVQATGQWQGAIWNRRKNGKRFSAWLNVKAVADEDGMGNKYVGVLSDLAARDHYVAQIRYQAFHDPLTGLPNRALYYNRLEHALAAAQRSRQMFAVMFLDLDGFKAVNDHFGHDTGDQLLKAVADRLRSCVRSSDTLARMGGDEFTLLLTQVKHTQDALTAARKIISAFKEPHELQGRSFYVTTSIGITLYPGNGSDAETLLKQADSAMYSAKQAGKNCCELYQNTPLI